LIVHTNIGQQITDATEQLAPDDEKYGDAHGILCEGLSRPFEQLAELVDPVEPYPPWGPLFDVTVCPEWALPWLAQLVGVRIPPGFTTADLRYLIGSVAGFKIGTADALRAAIEPFLNGTKTVYFRERNGDPYILDVVTLTGETPDPALVMAAMMAVKPAAIKITYRQVVGWDWEQVPIEVATWGDLVSEYATWYDAQIKDPI
jgi:Phage tail protein (Tail_P2_I)